MQTYKPSVFFEVQSRARVPSSDSMESPRDVAAEEVLVVRIMRTSIDSLKTLLMHDNGYSFLHQLVLLFIITTIIIFITMAEARCHCNTAAIVLAWVGGKTDWLYLMAVLDRRCQSQYSHVRSVEIRDSFLTVGGVDIYSRAANIPSFSQSQRRPLLGPSLA